MGINKILILIIGLLITDLEFMANCLNVNSHSYKMQLNETMPKEETSRETGELYLLNSTTLNNTDVLNEEVCSYF